MKWLRRGRQLNLAVRNSRRLREILGVFAKHGFTDVAVRMDLERFLPARWKSGLIAASDRPTEERLRIAFEELGPTFVKLGQVLATRSDLIPQDFVDELKKLQDNVSTLPFEMIRTVVERELGKPLTEAFASFEEKPIAAASIAQVHGAVLPTGEKVVVKIQRPDLERIINRDVALLDFLAKLLEKYVPESRIFAPATIVDEFFRTLKLELDFHIEANNIGRITENLAEFKDVKLPHVYRTHSTRHILTLERFFGIPMTQIAEVKAKGYDLKHLNEVGARAFFKTVVKDGIFHGDLHGGNLFVLEDGKLGLIDFGIVGRLSRRSRQQLSSMVLAIMTEDFEALCYQYAELGSAGPNVDFDGFQREVRNALAPYLGLRAKDINSGQVLIEATKIAAKYEIRVPGDWMIVFRALFTVEGLGRELDPDFDMMTLGRELMVDLVKDQYSPENFSKDALWIAKDMMALALVLPRQIRWMFKKFSADGYAFEVKSPQLDQLTAGLERNTRKLSLSILTTGLVIAAALSMQAPEAIHRFKGYPAPTIVLLVLALWTWFRV
ncbi:MAG: phosphotransferase [Cryobacterium sp.]|nr:phosphotransferase [Oligoflexia bacterium]